MGRIWMSHMVSAIADLGRQYLDRPISTSVVETAQQLCEDLLSSRGEAVPPQNLDSLIFVAALAAKLAA